MKKRIKFATPLLLAVLALSMLFGTASAHECYIFPRSQQGNLMAALNSPMWVRVGSLADVFGFMGGALGLQPLNADQLEYAVAKARQMGFPEDFVFFAGHTLLEGSAADGKRTNDLKGIEHAFDSVTGPLLEIYMDALNQ